MPIYKLKAFARFARGEYIDDDALAEAANGQGAAWWMPTLAAD